MKIHGFKAWRPSEAHVAEVACVPYDTVNREEAVALAKGLPRSFLHVVRPEIALPMSVDVHSDIVYATAAEALNRYMADGTLKPDEGTCLFLYRQKMGAHVQRGVVACCDAEDYRKNLILKHEKTRKDKEDDRTRHVKTLKANTGPVFLTYRDNAAIDALVRTVESTPPLYDIVAVDGVAHTIWRIADTTPFEKAFEAVPALYIADGHHRAAAAVRAASEFASENPAHRGDEEYNRFMAVLFPGSQLQILPYNRCVRDLNGLSEADFKALVDKLFTVTESLSPVVPSQAGEAGMYMGRRWFHLRWAVPQGGDPVDSLDVSVLQQRLLAPVLGIEDPRTSNRIEFIGGIRGTGALERLVNEGQGMVAFSMAPVTVDQMMAIADAGREMPPKSTWFEPKLRSGLLIHPF
ncbi:MAG TPA: DUF1015 domain-containing protein [Verrucomicrobia bacterium]|nr:DUF1015 domain-containing protein [Verrucomicrobiota bacterium]